MNPLSLHPTNSPPFIRNVRLLPLSRPPRSKSPLSLVSTRYPRDSLIAGQFSISNNEDFSWRLGGFGLGTACCGYSYVRSGRGALRSSRYTSETDWSATPPPSISRRATSKYHSMRGGLRGTFRKSRQRCGNLKIWIGYISCGVELKSPLGCRNNIVQFYSVDGELSVNPSWCDSWGPISSFSTRRICLQMLVRDRRCIRCQTTSLIDV
ncbi:hypothetical protein BDV93DRAFT_225480 [Ceratobasidium sp. AG-I]|nr:hypothetical protein BDV93DRAFT_225480 [Ceratobasidium sp. AG-I]